MINKRSEQFRFLFASDVDNFTEFPQGFVLAEDGELRYTVETAGGGGVPQRQRGHRPAYRVAGGADPAVGVTRRHF